MARMPGAKWQPLATNFASQPKMRAYDIICVHTMVGGLIGTDGYFRTGNGLGYAGTESHFGTGGEGEIVQWQDTLYQAEANLNGNHHILSIENADMGPGFPKWNTQDGSAVPAFTEAQREAIAQIIAWACKAHNIPCVLIPDAKPGRRGIGYHRQGVPGYMVAGAERWSNAQGKVCPGNRRVAQIPGIIKRAQAILAANNGLTKPTTTTNTNITVNREDNEMNTDERKIVDETSLVVKEILGQMGGRLDGGKVIWGTNVEFGGDPVKGKTADGTLVHAVRKLTAAVNDLPRRVVEDNVLVNYEDQKVNLRSVLNGVERRLVELLTPKA